MSLKSLIKKMNALAKTNKAELAMVVSMQATLAERIFDQGKAADGSQIGEYSKGYLKTRLSNGYSASKKVILQATRQMVNDWSVINDSNALGLGFKNQTDADKSGWVEETYKKPIFESTKEEIKLATDIYQDNVNKILNG